MSGICSAHQGHNPDCRVCNAVPLTEMEKEYYKGWNDSLEAAKRNGWAIIEIVVEEAYLDLAKAVKERDFDKAEKISDTIEKFGKLIK